MLSKFCEECVYRDECGVLDPRECGEFISVEDYIRKYREEYRDAFSAYTECRDEH